MLYKWTILFIKHFYQTITIWMLFDIKKNAITSYSKQAHRIVTYELISFDWK